MEDIVAATAAVPIVAATAVVLIVAATVPVGTAQAVQAVTVPVVVVILPATTKIPGGSTRFGRV
jgi:hypothetical protein